MIDQAGESYTIELNTIQSKRREEVGIINGMNIKIDFTVESAVFAENPAINWQIAKSTKGVFVRLVFYFVVILTL